MIEIINLMNERAVTPDEAKGIVGKSPLLDLEYFHFVKDITGEYLHCVCLGVTKRLTELTFDVGNLRPRITNRKLSLASNFNTLMIGIKVPGEFSRRVRALDFAVMKGQEFRNLILFFFPIIIACIEKPAGERRLWLLFSYMIRACAIPNDEFQNVSPTDIKYCYENFYELYETLFGQRNYSYNTHIVFSHIEEIRQDEPLTENSAFIFENFYGEMRRSFTPGVVSPLKQIMQKIYLKRNLQKHTCTSLIKYSNYETALESNMYIYTFYQNNYFLYRIIDTTEEDNVLCVEIEKKKHDFEETPTLDWGKVGVFQAVPEGTEVVVIEKKDIAGKLIKVLDLFITCPKNILKEK